MNWLQQVPQDVWIVLALAAVLFFVWKFFTGSVKAIWRILPLAAVLYVAYRLYLHFR